MKNRSGIYFYKLTSKWTANITVLGKRHHLGYFETEKAATQARRDAEVLHGVCKTYPDNHTFGIADWQYLFVYDQSTGRLFNKVHRLNGALIGQYADSVVRSGYRIVNIFGKHFRAHRIVWELQNSPIPEGLLIDHINRIRSDNRIANLRLVDSTGNNMNLSRRSDCQIVPGVFFSTKEKKFRAHIAHRGARHYLGDFKDVSDAIAARKRAAETMGFTGEAA